MVKAKKKGTSGQAKNFITRTQAVRKLQISLPDFRRLCIFKGIYPREPRNKKKASKSSTPSTTFYYTKDIQYLLHEPLLTKFREHKTLAKKISKALGRGDNSDAARLEKTHTPRLSLDHIIKERYPTFIDALRDLDDALSMLFLFANLPSTSTVPPQTIALCKRLCLEFQHYLIVTHSIRKSFLSIKGIYYQATVQGQDILWLVPYQFVQRVTGDVDFRIMGTFVEFYTTLLGFVNFRLYNSIGLVYPPKFNPGSDDRGGDLRAFMLEAKSLGDDPASNNLQIEGGSNDIANDDADVETLRRSDVAQDGLDQAQLATVVRQIAADEANEEEVDARNGNGDGVEEEAGPLEDTIDNFDVQVANDADVLPQPSLSTETASTLFASFTFFLSRETPRQPLEFLLRAFGCKRIGWDEVLGDGAFTTDEIDKTITHQVVDRPPLPPDVMSNGESADTETDGDPSAQPPTRSSRNRMPGRIYVQPQWVWDCVNAGKLIRPDTYAPGAELPPHLSPFVKPTAGEYDPTVPLAEQELGDELSDVEKGAEEGEEEEEEESDAVMDPIQDENHIATTSLDDTTLPVSEIRSGQSLGSSSPKSSTSWDGLTDDEAEATQHQRELEAEVAGVSIPRNTGNDTSNDLRKRRQSLAARKRREKDEELDRQKMMMSRKKRKVLDKMLYSNQKKEEVAEGLRSKRRKIEMGKDVDR
ncbi:MAG: mRNA-binding ribosome synthesis protein nop7 [Sclerophora amabilis]|nr:MAG: mRNA-binding ribosome synthesis protein nop7 [Sclerophora amabilis]